MTRLAMLDQPAGQAVHPIIMGYSGCFRCLSEQAVHPRDDRPDPPPPPRIHIDDAARLSLPALMLPGGVTVVVDDRAG